MGYKKVGNCWTERNYEAPEVKSQLTVLTGKWYWWSDYYYGGEPVELGAVNGYERELSPPGVRTFVVTTGPHKGDWVSGTLRPEQGAREVDTADEKYLDYLYLVDWR